MEIHESSTNHLREIDKLVKDSYILGLSGTITGKTEKEILTETGIGICYRYPISQAVEEGVLADYQITVHKVPLDNKEPMYLSAKKVWYDEKSQFKRMHYVMEQLKKNGDNPFFMELKLISILQNSIAKIAKTKALLAEYSNERVLVFCGQTKVADSLGIPVYHSKNKDKEIFNKFCRGEDINHLATVALMNAGVTVMPIDKAIINYNNGSPENFTQRACRLLGTELNRPDKKAQIQVLSTTEPFDSQRLKSSLDFFDPCKITYI